MTGISQNKGRDSTAICDTECTIFVMPISEVNKIKDLFDEVYQEMLAIAIKRHNNHKILISKEVKAYIQRVKVSDGSDSSDLSSQDVVNDSGSNSDLEDLIKNDSKTKP